MFTFKSKMFIFILVRIERNGKLFIDRVVKLEYEIYVENISESLSFRDFSGD